MFIRKLQNISFILSNNFLLHHGFVSQGQVVDRLDETGPYAYLIMQSSTRPADVDPLTWQTRP